MHRINPEKPHMLTQFKAMAAWGSDAECSFWGRSLPGPFSLLGCMAPL